MCVEDDCPSEQTDRRSFLVAATATLAGLAISSPAQLSAQQKPETRVLDNPTIDHGRVVFKHNGVETIDGYLARPKAEGKYSSVLVIAGNRISEEYIPNTCAALAVSGFVGVAPNIFHTLPDSARTLAEMRKATENHTENDVLEDIDIAADYLRGQKFVQSESMGILGLCFGGRIAMLYGARSQAIDAVVAFHPGVTKVDDIKRLRAPLQIHHGTVDHSVAASESQRLTNELQRSRRLVELLLYEGADHGFLAYTRPTYKPDAAKLAWGRTVQFLRNHLKISS